MRVLTHKEMDYVSGGYDLTDDPLGGGDLVPGQGSFDADTGPASGSSTGGSGNGGISPDTAQTAIGTITIVGAVTDPATALESGDTADSANTVQNYNQSQSQQICEQVDGGTWDSSANNGGGGCVLQ